MTGHQNWECARPFRVAREHSRWIISACYGQDRDSRHKDRDSRHKEDAGCISTNYSAGGWKIKGSALTSAIGMVDEDDEEQQPQPQAAQPQEGTSTMRGDKKEQ